MMLQRKAGWEGRLARVESELHASSWKYGTHDCCQAGLRVIDALTKSNLRGTVEPYSSLRSSRVVCRQNLETFIREMARTLNATPVHPQLAKRGDPVLVCLKPRTYALGFISSTGKVKVASLVGLSEVSFDDAVAAWSIP